MTTAMRGGLLILAIVAVALHSACGVAPTPDEGSPLDPIISAVTLHTDARLRGTIVSTQPLQGLSADIMADSSARYRVAYRSTSGITGEQSVVTGMFLLPTGKAPRGGWPIVSFAHGTTGAAHRCGVSYSADLVGYGKVVAPLLHAGYAVAATDYQGLGPTGDHPYLDRQTAAFNVIDAVRALRHLTPAVSDRWVGYGDSQGGQAVWAANEVAAHYGKGLTLLGTVATSPATNVTALAQLLAHGTLSRSQQVIAPLVVVGASRIDPAVRVSDLLPGGTADTWATALGCNNSARVGAARTIEADSTQAPQAAAVTALATVLRQQALPQSALTAPLLVLNGSADEVVRPAWVQKSVTASCGLGGDIEHDVVSGASHGQLRRDQQALDWVGERFAGEPTRPTC